jgi:hypothetical protein
MLEWVTPERFVQHRNQMRLRATDLQLVDDV